MQRGYLRVWTGIREVDGVPDALAAQRFTGVKVPAEEGVNNHREVCEVFLFRGRNKIDVHSVAIVQRSRRVVIDATRLWSQTDAANEGVEGYYALL